MIRTRIRRLGEVFTWAPAGSQGTPQLDLKALGCDKPILQLILRFVFNVQSVAAQQVAQLGQDASALLFAERFTMHGTHTDIGKIETALVGRHFAHLWHAMNDLDGKEQKFLDPTPNNTNLDGFREFVFRFDAPWSKARFASYLDPREYTSLKIDLVSPAITAYAASQLQAINNPKFQLWAEEVEEGLEEGRAHYEVCWKSHEHPFTTVSKKVAIPPITFDGDVPIVWITPYDESAVGNAERDVAGLIRRASMFQGSQKHLDDDGWMQMVMATERNFPLSYTTGRKLGPVAVLFDKYRDFQGLVKDSDTRPLTITLDTETAPELGTAAVVPALGDAIDVLGLVLKPNAALKRVLRAGGTV